MRISDWSSDVCSSDLAVESVRAQVSLARRMVLIASGWIAVLLIGGGIALDRSMTSLVEQNFDEQLTSMLTAMIDRKSTSLNSSHYCASRMPSPARNTTHVYSNLIVNNKLTLRITSLNTQHMNKI